MEAILKSVLPCVGTLNRIRSCAKSAPVTTVKHKLFCRHDGKGGSRNIDTETC